MRKDSRARVAGAARSARAVPPARPDRSPARSRPPFRRVLIANRGEIAVRIIRACRSLGIEAVAVYSDADADSLHVRLADEAVRIGPSPAAESYLRPDAIVDAARAAAAEAVHPGYGFLSERAELAEACAAAGLAFVGPAPATLRALGDKLAARRTARAAGVPIVPGTLEPLELAATAQAVTAEAADGLARLGEEVGFPLLVKATAGGGGRGMRRVDAPAELMDAAAAAGREAAAAFGDGSIYLERYVERARHVEVQLIGDDHGTLVALGERDCSIQRRHQKLVEEAPAPGLTRQQRERLHELARAVAGAVGVRNAVTAEFLLSPTGDFWFLEVNARLQVEHGVTELVSGVDIVVEQLRVAAGARLSADVLSAAGRAAEPERHAIEVRLSAEDPAHGFAPAAGTLTSWREPTGAGLRVDSGVEQGSRVSAYYDPLLAKVLAVAPDRASAIARLAAALDEMLIGGLQTTLPFHRWLLELPEFTGGDGLSTDLVSRLWRPEQIVAGAARRAAELAAADYLAVPTASSEPATAADPPAERWWRAGLADAFERRA